MKTDYTGYNIGSPLSHRDSSSSNNGNTEISNSSKKVCVQHFSGTQQKPPEQPNEYTSTELPRCTNRHMLLWL